MIGRTARVTLLSSVAAIAFGTAYAQTSGQAEGTTDAQVCVTLAERLANDTAVEADVRTEIENVISTGDGTQCRVVFTAWEKDGSISRESLELVTTDTATQRMVVQQEIEVNADVAVYQPPAEVGVDTGTPEVIWTMPRQSVTIDEQAPQIVVRQGQPTVHVEFPQVRVTVVIPEPEILVTWPESTLDLSALKPTIEVRMPEPTVTVSMPDPVVELTIGGAAPTDLVELGDGRFAPQGVSEADLEPKINIQQREATVTAGQQSEPPEVVFNRAEPVVTFETELAEVTVVMVGEQQINVSGGQQSSPAVGSMNGNAEGQAAPEQEDGKITE